MVPVLLLVLLIGATGCRSDPPPSADSPGGVAAAQNSMFRNLGKRGASKL
jgi:hypothetical protein